MPKADPCDDERPLSEREEGWRTRNAEGVAASNRYVERSGLPLAKYRCF